MRNTCDIVHYQIRSLYSCLFMNRIEPSQNIWLCISTIQFENFSFSYDTSYRFFGKMNKEDASAIYNKQYNDALKYPQNYLHRIIIMKLQIDNELIYLCRKCEKNDGELSEEEEKIEKSDVKFMTIEYSNPKMEHRLELFIGREWFMQKNELFTPTHVLHMLEHQNEPYFFDMNYNIHIIDSNINMLELSSSKYIKLDKKKYDIIDYCAQDEKN